VTAYTYDSVGNKLTQTDAEGRTTHWTYDYQGRVLSRTLPMGQTETFSYDSAGNRLSHTDFNGETTTYQHDSNGRLVRAFYSDGSVESFSFDAVGNRLSATTVEGTTQYRYDVMNRLEEEVQPNGSLLTYTYDGAGNRVLLEVEAGDQSQSVEYAFDSLNRLALVSDSKGDTEYRYDSVGNRASVSYPSGNVTRYGYDALNRLTRLTTTDAFDTVVAEYLYELDLTGRRNAVEESHNGRRVSYTYDELYRLTGETVSDPVNGGHSAQYEYDKVGNRTYSTVNGVLTAYRYDANDRLIEQGGVTYRYDANGNTLSETQSGQITQYRYDARNRLVESSRQGYDATYGYNADGIRTRRTENGIATQFVVDSNRDYAQVIAEIVNGNTEASYTYGDDLVAQQRSGVTDYYLYDGLGSTRGLADENGNVTDTYFYEAFGELLASTGDSENEYLYTGEQRDAGLGQYYLRARYYDQGVGRFTQMDTWGGINNQPVTLNKYLYANADPGNMVDPSGHFSIGSVMAAVNTVARLTTTAARATGGVALRFAKSASNLGKQVVSAGRTATIRVHYTHRVRGLKRVAEQMRRNGKSSEEIAKVVNQKRRALGRLFKHATDPKTRQNAFERNKRRYGDKWGPTWQYLRSQGNSWDDIIESAARPNSSLQELTKIFFGK